MPEYPSYEDKVEALKKAARETSGVAEKHDDAIKRMETERKDLERSEKIGAFRDGVKEAVSEWLDRNKPEALDAIKHWLTDVKV